MKRQTKMPLPGVKKIILVVSGKGGVGKSTIAANLAVSLQKKGLQTGLLDSDIYGPSIPKIFSLDKKAEVQENQLIPFESHGVKLMSMGFLVPEDAAVIWRGPMTTKALHQLFRTTKWAASEKELDYLIVDTPPGTGDVHLSIVENYHVDAAIVVSTPQPLAIIDAFKAIDMLHKLQIKIIGMLENMAYFTDNEGKKSQIFGDSQLTKRCQEQNIEFLGALPISAKVAANYFFPAEMQFLAQTLEKIILY